MRASRPTIKNGHFMRRKAHFMQKILLDFSSRIFLCWHYLFSRAVTHQLSSANLSLTSVFGMETGGPSGQSIPTSSIQTSYRSLPCKHESSFTPLYLLSKLNDKFNLVRFICDQVSLITFKFKTKSSKPRLQTVKRLQSETTSSVMSKHCRLR